ncbi:kinase-like protein [Trametes punicea]|nr:kinase-like protein [Trametes punicea]
MYCAANATRRQLCIPATVIRGLTLEPGFCPCNIRHISFTSTTRQQDPRPPGIPRHSGPSEWDEEEEPLADYDATKNGYLPVTIGDVLGSRYKVLRKLGWGVYSTVWIAEDQRETQRPTYSALKVMTRVATDAQDRLKELELMQYMRTTSPSHPGYSHVIQLLDHFYQQGPHGRHLCLVLEPLLQDLRSLSLRFTDHIFPSYFVRLLARQAVLALQYLHEECDIVHTDVKASNFMMVPPGDATAFLAMTIPRLNAAETSARTGPDGTVMPRARSRPIPYPLPDLYDLHSFDIWSGARVKIGDVGVACRADKITEHFTELIQTPPLRAPEVAIGAGWGKPADVWSLGCTLYELYMGQTIFGKNICDMEVPAMHTMMLGDYPPELIERGKARNEFFNSNGKLKRPPDRRIPFDQAVRGRDTPDAALFADFLRLTFALDPDKRATCRDLLNHPWLNL